MVVCRYKFSHSVIILEPTHDECRYYLEYWYCITNSIICNMLSSVDSMHYAVFNI